MPPRLLEHALVTLLRQLFITPRCQALRQQSLNTVRRSRALHTASSYEQSRPIQLTKFKGSTTEGNKKSIGPNQDGTPSRVAILGGGITGLAAAHFLTRELPKTEITIYEGSDRLGGWMKSKRVDVGNGEVVFEQGPRTLRPNPPAGLVTLDIIKNLGLESELLITSNDSVAAKSRFIYYPDHLVRMPGPGQDLYAMAWSIMTEPIFRGLIFGGLLEYFRPPRASYIADESIASFMTRRLGTPLIGENITSAVLHGIYAGDIHKLSAKSLLSRIYRFEAEHGSMMKGMLDSMQKGSKHGSARDAKLHNEMAARLKGSGLLERMQSASVYTLKSGLEGLSDAIVAKLYDNPNVTIKVGAKVQAVALPRHADANTSEKILINVTTCNDGTIGYDHVISTLPAAKLSAIAGGNLDVTGEIRSATVMVVNLFFSDANLLPEPGFGYLIPRSISHDQNPECALGVVFDSYSSVGQDTATGTKVTVMLGGHWWDAFREDEYPTEAEGSAMALSILKRHLKIDAVPEKVLVGLQRDCIPQYEVGHSQRLLWTDEMLMMDFDAKLSVAGSSYLGVGVNDCVRSAYDLVRSLAKGSAVFTTGLASIRVKHRPFKRQNS